VAVIALASFLLTACNSDSDAGTNNHRLPAPVGVQNRQPHTSYVPSTPTATWAPPAPTVVAPCMGFDPATIRTVGDVIEQLGPPEKVYFNVAHYFGRGEQNTVWRTTSNSTIKPLLRDKVIISLLYPSKGVDFILGGSDEKLRREAVIKDQDCYVPVDLAMRLKQLPRGIVGSMTSVYVRHANWTGFNNETR
jgi:hypothetical protein